MDKDSTIKTLKKVIYRFYAPCRFGEYQREVNIEIVQYEKIPQNHFDELQYIKAAYYAAVGKLFTDTRITEASMINLRSRIDQE